MAPSSSRPTVETRSLPAGKTVVNILGTSCAGGAAGRRLLHQALGAALGLPAGGMRRRGLQEAGQGGRPRQDRGGADDFPAEG